MNESTNDQLAIYDLPSLEDIDWVKMDPNLIARDTIHRCLVSFFLLIGAGALGITFFFLDNSVLRLIVVSGFCVVLLLIILLMLWPRLEFPHRGYALRELDIAEKFGLLIRVLATVPFSRVQHVFVIEGVLDRMFKLATLQIYTAGGVTAYTAGGVTAYTFGGVTAKGAARGVTVIRGFPSSDAHALREHILERVAEINAQRIDALAEQVDAAPSPSDQ